MHQRIEEIRLRRIGGFSRIRLCSEPFVKSVKEAIGWEEPKEAPQKMKKYFPNLKKDPESFPFTDELEDLIKEEE